MLEVGAVVDTGREHDHLRMSQRAQLVGGQRQQQSPQMIRIVVDRQDRLAFEQVGEGSLGDRPVLQKVADTRRHSEVVFEHVDDSLGIAHEIAAADVRPHAELR